MNTHQAEVKPVKFRETVTDNADGNPEPSPNREGAETRQRVCKKCGKLISKIKRKDAIYCSKLCRQSYGSYKYQVDKGLIKKPGIGSGGNQWLKNNSQWKGGVATFRRLAKEIYDEKCAWCNSTKNLLVHHLDHNRLNNDISNLIVICKSCHQKHHTTRNPKTGKYIKG